MRRHLVLFRQLHLLLWQHGLLLLLGLGLFLLDKYERLPPGGITALLLLGAAGKTAYFLLHNFRAMGVFRRAFQQFLLLISLNLGMIALSFALDFYCLYRINHHAFKGIRSGSEWSVFVQVLYLSVGTLISNSGGNIAAVTDSSQALLLLEKVAGFVSTVFIISNAANYVAPAAPPAAD